MLHLKTEHHTNHQPIVPLLYYRCMAVSTELVGTGGHDDAT